MTADPEAATPAATLPRVSLIGAGALGLSFAARLAAHGPLQVITRTSAQAKALRAGIRIGSQRHRFEACSAASAQRTDWVIILVKTPATAAAFATALALQPRGIVSLQNGLIDAWLPPAPAGMLIDQGVTTAGAWRDEHGIHPTSCGETLLPPGFEVLAEVMNAAGLPTQICADLPAARLAKLLVNAAINPLAAIFQCRNGELLDAQRAQLLATLVSEAWPVLHAAGLQLDEQQALARVRAVARDTAGNRASMLQDILAGRPSEIDAITGAVLRMANAQGRRLPTHQAVRQLVEVLQARTEND